MFKWFSTIFLLGAPDNRKCYLKYLSFSDERVVYKNQATMSLPGLATGM